MALQTVLVARSFLWDRSLSKFLLLQRASVRRNNPGLWEGPGGQVEDHQDPRDALPTEISQETGFSAVRVALWHESSRLIETPDGEPNTRYLALTTISTVTSGTFNLSNEHQDFAWVSYEEMLQYKLTPECRDAARALEKELRAIECN